MFALKFPLTMPDFLFGICHSMELNQEPLHIFRVVLCICMFINNVLCLTFQVANCGMPTETMGMGLNQEKPDSEGYTLQFCANGC